MRLVFTAAIPLLAATVISCEKTPPAGEQAPAASEQPPATPEQPPAAGSGGITDRDWVLVALGEQIAPMGAGNQPATMRVDGASSTAAGFAGCNRYRSQVTLSGDSLRFGPAMSTKMACADGDELERGFLAALEKIATFEVSDSSLTLNAAGKPLMQFRPL